MFYYWQSASRLMDYDVQRNLEENSKPPQGGAPVKLSVQHILGALFMLLFGNALAVISFLLEMLFKIFIRSKLKLRDRLFVLWKWETLKIKRFRHQSDTFSITIPIIYTKSITRKLMIKKHLTCNHFSDNKPRNWLNYCTVSLLFPVWWQWELRWCKV